MEKILSALVICDKFDYELFDKYMDSLREIGSIYCLYNEMYNYYGNNVYKIGKSGNIKNRLKTYNSGNANDIKILFKVKVKDMHAVERCVKDGLKEVKYRKYKEIYNIDLDIIKRVMIKCADFFDGLKDEVKNEIAKNNLKELKNKKNKLFMTFIENTNDK